MRTELIELLEQINSDAADASNNGEIALFDMLAGYAARISLMLQRYKV